ncbi:hypothetical protein PoB_005053900 [Plakobranchus ocellatus]|uniref:Uncharacterized protein n=1 Tax=Plakobranchus ocellatus TaxID=259542 RepID=A0AAV4BV08_9GAST|nr:hypothetical protein PoB_005053900 [Plakobranchus ocellatus]
MDVENMLEAEDKLNSAILLDGNYFIMDSEQLVSNPFAELQQEAVQQAEQQGKRSTMTERLTSVKNNVCENHFLMARSRLEREKTSRLKQLHDNSNRLRHEVKLLDLDKQRHQVEIKRRVEPDKDHSYDEVQVSNTEKRLGANIASFYLDKRLKYPVRIRSVSDISLTPTVQKARASLRQSELKKSSSEEIGDGAADGNTRNMSRAQTAKSVSSSLHSSVASQASGPPRSLFRRRDSRSAPLHTRSGRNGAGSGLGSAGWTGSKTSLLPAISTADKRQRRLGGTKGSRSATGKDKNNNDEVQNVAPHVVKFAFENPLKILASNEESAKLFSQPRAAYYPGATRSVHPHHNHTGYSDTSEDEDDDGTTLPDRIDLKAMFSTAENPVAEYTLQGMQASHGIGNCVAGLTPHQLAMLRKAQGPPPRLTTDMMQVETDKINNKVKSFMTTLAYNTAAQAASRKLSIIEQLNNDENKLNSNTNITITDLKGDKTQQQQPLPRFVSKGTSTNTGVNTNSNKETITSDLSAQNQTSGTLTDITITVTDENAASTQPQGQAPKYSWKYIRGREQHTSQGETGLGEVGEKGGDNVRAEDLILQALTGIPMRNALHTHVPLHSASRALRHTATFKMHKVVERLIGERTKYQRHQVDELKRQMSIDGGVGGPGGAGPLDVAGDGTGTGSGAGNPGPQGPPSRRISRVSISSIGSDRKLAAR